MSRLSSVPWVVFTVVAIVAIPPGASGGAYAGSFLQKEGEGQAIAAGSFSDSNLVYNSAGLLALAARVRVHELSVLVEYGFDPLTTLLFKPSLLHVNNAAAPEAVATGSGLIEAGVRRGVGHWGDAVFSLQGSVRVPGQRQPAFGSQNQAQAEARLGVGMPYSIPVGAFFSINGFVDASAAYVRRSGSLADEMRADVTLGMDYGANRMILWQVFNTWSLTRTFAGTIPRVHKVQSSMVYRVTPDWSVQFGVFSSVAGGSSRYERGVMTAVWRRF